jgi:hypothetical protein
MNKNKYEIFFITSYKVTNRVELIFKYFIFTRIYNELNIHSSILGRITTEISKEVLKNNE